MAAGLLAAVLPAAGGALAGARGDDRLEGRDGDDTLRAYEGNNQKVYGGAGSDACDGDNLVVLDQCERVPF